MSSQTSTSPSIAELSGRPRVAGQPQTGAQPSFRAFDPREGRALEPEFISTSADELDAAVEAAASAFRGLRKLSNEQRAAGLEAIADSIESLGSVLIERAMAETGLPQARLVGERRRTCNQLRLFAQLLREGQFERRLEVEAQPERSPIPRPRLSLSMQGIGPVAVFGASNFPLAFSTAGGDTAAALAAGCPVVYRGHPAHPGTTEFVAKAIDTALAEQSWPAGAFSLVQGPEHSLGADLVRHPGIAAVAFTGSQAGGRALLDIAASRRMPIPVFAEMGSVNPVYLSAGVLADRSQALAEQFAASLTGGVGQFCTKPGVIFLPACPERSTFVEQLRAALSNVSAAPMLSPAIATNYRRAAASLLAHAGVHAELNPDPRSDAHALPRLARTNAESFAFQPELAHEVFGPMALLVECEDAKEAEQVIFAMEGQLSGTIHALENELEELEPLVDAFELRVGRLCFGGVPTGVEVNAAMHHGGPYPASTDARFTSVGTRAIERFLRPLCRQNWPT